MILKQLEINGFKSFDKKVSLDFSHSIVGIVGPNGSGKSNILEAFRFVLGEQSLKSMRGKKGEDLIFNGGSKGNKKNLASIVITFDNKNSIFDIEYPKIKVERRVYRDGTNEYYINDTAVRLKDIIELLAKANITPGGNQIISQGQADWVLNANPLNRREIIENGLGLKIFQYRKKEGERKLERTKTQIEQVEAIRKEMQPHLKFLQKQTDKIKNVKLLREKLEEEYEEYIPAKEKYLSENEEQIKTDINKIQKKLNEINKQIENKIDVKITGNNKEEISKLKNELNTLRGIRDNKLLILGRIEGAMEVKKESGNVSREKFLNIQKEIEYIVKDAENEVDVSTLKMLFQKIKNIFIKFNEKNDTSTMDDKEYIKVKNEVNQLENKEKGAVEKIIKLEELDKKENEMVYIKEKQMFEYKNQQIKLEGEKNILNEKMNSVNMEKSLFLEELQEGKVLVGEKIEIFRKKKVEIESREIQERKRKDIERLKIKIEEMGNTKENSEELEKKYNEIIVRDKELEEEIQDLHKAMEGIVEMIEILTIDIEKKFKNGIVKINKHFNEYFKTLFGSGTASIELIKTTNKKKVIYDEVGQEIEIEEDLEQEGIEIKVLLPYKKIKTLDALSGGERALVSIALLFSISQVVPPPFLILDETDAALDEANSKRYGDIIYTLSKSSQLILITHNRETMSRTNILYGVTMDNDGTSKILSVKLAEAINVAK